MTLRVGLLATLVFLTPCRAAAQSPVRKTFSLLTGAAAGLVVHESGHVMTGSIFGAHPSTKPIRYAGIPFFEIASHIYLANRE